MFARVLALLPFVLIASASHLEARDECSTGDIHCCNSDSISEYKSILGSAGGVVAALHLGSILGSNCSPIAGNACGNQEPVCCNNNEFTGAINIGCSPININL